MTKQEMIVELNRLTGIDKKSLNELSMYIITKAYLNDLFDHSQHIYLSNHIKHKRLRKLLRPKKDR